MRTLAILALLGWASVASAQDDPPIWDPDFDFELFTASPDPRAVSVIDGARTLEKWSYGTGIVLHYSDTPLQVCMSPPEGGDCAIAGAAVSSRVRADVVAALGLGRVELRLVVPAVLDQGTPLEPPMGEDGLASTGVADLRPGVKVRLVERGPLALAAAADLTIPTGGGGANFIGDSGVSLTPRAIVDFRRGRLALAGGFGYRWRSETAELANVVIDDQLTWSLGGEVAVIPKLSVGLAAYGAIGVAGHDTGADERPMEAVLSSRYWVTDRIAVEAGGGPGIATGVGTPEFRLFAGVRWANLVYDADHDGVADADDRCPTDAEDRDEFQDADGCPDPDNDGDRIADALDKCRNEAEDRDSFQDDDGCPEGDNDGDGVADTRDRCRNEAEDKDSFQDDDGCPEDDDQDGVADAVDRCRTEAEDKDSFQDDDGCPEADNDGDGLADASDRCPVDPEDVDQFQDDDGCPDPDNDGDQIADRSDRCPNEAETYNNNDDEDGCPDAGKVLAVVVSSEIAITDKIFFDYNRARIKNRSHPVLNAVASVIKANPALRVRIEGHTDDQGSDDFNLKLSQRRAEAVMKYLIDKGGVLPEQLTAVGYGKTRPLEEGTSEKARATNRRVEFLILPAAGTGGQ